MRLPKYAFCFCLVFLFAAPAHAGDLKKGIAGLELLSLGYGINDIGQDLTIMRGKIVTETASARDAYTVFSDGQWALYGKRIAIETWPHTGEDSLVSIRFMKPKGGEKGQPLYLLRAQRKLEEGYAPSSAVFTLFRLKQDEGFGELYFDEVSTMSSAAKYCNSDWAMHKELGLPLRGEEGELPCD